MVVCEILGFLLADSRKDIVWTVSVGSPATRNF